MWRMQDGRTTGFDADMGMHYETALHFAFDAHLVGSPDPATATAVADPSISGAFAAE